MEVKTAEILPKKKLNKTKLKKTIKNVLCRPDGQFWPRATDSQKDSLETVLKQHALIMPEFKKPLWKDLKSIPKEKRPKPPKIERVDGLIFGISECSTAIQDGQCSAIIIEATVNPRSIVQPILEACSDSRIPALCIEGLRQITSSNFGIPTSCLGVKKNFLLDISQKVSEMGTDKLPPMSSSIPANKMDTELQDDTKNCNSMVTEDSINFQYLHRTNKKVRVFVPPTEEKLPNDTKKFLGQDYIEFAEKLEPQKRNQFKKMIIKRITNNANRVKLKS